MGKFCDICGKPSGMFPLCREHNQMKEQGKVVKCEFCGKWHYRNKPCDCIRNSVPDNLFDEGKKETADIKSNSVVINEQNKSRCIACGRSTDGLLFCTSCYHKFKHKTLLFRVTNCSNVELLDEDYEGRYTCKDGHIVKSKSEREIDNYLYEHGIMHAYERELSYGPSANEVLHPDFYLPDYLGQGKHVYIEHWGYNENNIQYTKTKKFKLPIYEKLGITLVCTDEKSDMGKIDTVLDRKLNKSFIKVGEINNN